jgi:hypothetical protein
MSSALTMHYPTIASVARDHLDAHAKLMGYTVTRLNCYRSDLKITCFVKRTSIFNAMSFNNSPNYHLIFGKMNDDSWKVFERGAELFAYMKESLFESLENQKEVEREDQVGIKEMDLLTIKDLEVDDIEEKGKE